MKLAFLKIVLCLTVLSMYSCTEDPVLTQETKSDIGILSGSDNNCLPQTVDLIAGQNTVVGSVTVEEEGDKIKITYTTDGDWRLSEVHLFTGALEDMPQTKSGNPKVGHFPKKRTFELRRSSQFVYTVRPECFAVAAHAVVKKVENGRIVQEETAWGEGSRMVEKGNWAMYFDVCKCTP